MGIFDNWFLDTWAALAILMTGVGVFFLILGVCMVAVEGRRGWSNVHEVFLLMAGLGIFFPFIVVGLPFYALYRAVRNK